MKILGLTGLAGSGKDTVAEFLMDQNQGYCRAFADPLRRAAVEIFGLTHEQLLDRGLKEQEIPYWGMSPRQILQKLGTECIRDVFGPETWVKRAELELEMVKALDTREPLGAKVIVFTDVRFVEEAEFIHRHGGVVVRVNRPGCVPESAHSSENGLADECVDYELMNDGDLGQLREVVRLGAKRWIGSAEDMCDLRKARVA